MESRWHVVKSPSQKKYRRTLALGFLVYSVCFGGAMFFIPAVLRNAPSPLIFRVGIAVVSGVLYGAGMTWFTARMWRRNGGLETSVLMQSAIRRQRLPSDIDSGEWHRLLKKQETGALRGRWLYPSFFAVFAAIFLVAALANIFPGLGFLCWIGVALFLGMGIYSPFETKRRLRRIMALKSELATRPPLDPSNPE